MQNSKLDRAKQFMPFAALRGYYDLIRQCEKIKEPKKELSESEAEILSSKISEIKKGVIVKIKYYNIDAYDEITGMVSDFDETYKTLTVIKTKIYFNNILNIEVCN